AQTRHWIIVANYADDLHARQMTRGGGEESCGAAEHVVGLAEGRFDGIQRDRSNDDDGHQSCVRVIDSVPLAIWSVVTCAPAQRCPGGAECCGSRSARREPAQDGRT